MTDPLLSYNFRVRWDGRYVAAVTSVSGLVHKTAEVSFHAGGVVEGGLKIPGQSDHVPVRLERGIITDRAFEDWAQEIWMGRPTSGGRCRSSCTTRPARSCCATTSTTAGRASTRRCPSSTRIRARWR